MLEPCGEGRAGDVAPLLRSTLYLMVGVLDALAPDIPSSFPEDDGEARMRR